MKSRNRMRVAVLLALSAVQSWAAPAPPQEALIATSKGTIVVRLLPEIAPLHVQHFVQTAKAGGYGHTTFHRVIAGGIIQGGDPLSKDPKKTALYGRGGLGLLKAEFSERPFVRGVVAAARRPGDPNSGGTQFFIVLREQPGLRGQYTIFGEVSSGLEVADEISTTPSDGDKARERVEMQVSVRDAPAPSTGATP